MKTNKSYSKRLKVTKNGKIKSRVTGQNHFNTKMSGTERLSKNRTQDVQMTEKDKARFLKKKK